MDDEELRKRLEGIKDRLEIANARLILIAVLCLITWLRGC